MKYKLYTTVALCLLMVTGIVTSCNKDIEISEQLVPLTPAKLDENAGTWDMVLLTGPTQITIAPPSLFRQMLIWQNSLL